MYSTGNISRVVTMNGILSIKRHHYVKDWKECNSVNQLYVNERNLVQESWKVRGELEGNFLVIGIKTLCTRDRNGTSEIGSEVLGDHFKTKTGKWFFYKTKFCYIFQSHWILTSSRKFSLTIILFSCFHFFRNAENSNEAPRIVLS